MKTILSILLFLCFQSNICVSQNYFYGIHHWGSNYYFSRYDLTSHTFTDLQVVPGMVSVAGHMSACVDPINSIYYVFTGSNIIGFNLNSGVIVSNYVFPLPGYLNNLQFSPCDTLIYGLLNTAGNVQLVSINPSDSSTNIVFNVTAIVGFCGGCQGFIDPSGDKFVVQTPGGILGLGIKTGLILYYVPIINIQGEQFGHICLDCSSHTIFGTSANISVGVKYLSTIDPVTGIVSHVAGSSGWNTGIWKPVMAGSMIDQAASIYYYIGAGNLLNGIDLNTGNLVSSHFNIPEMYLIEHVPECLCTSTGMPSSPGKNNSILVTNPFSDEIYISTSIAEPLEFTLFDITGKKITNQTFTLKTLIDTRQFPKAVYLYYIKGKNGKMQAGKILKV